MVSMPDVNIVCTSSTERDLRFYDCSANTFTLKIIITSWEYMVTILMYSGLILLSYTHYAESGIRNRILISSSHSSHPPHLGEVGIYSAN